MHKIKRLVWMLINLLPDNWKNAITVKIKKNLPKYMSEERLRKELGDLYFKKTANTIDFSNPKTFSEKLQWLKLYYYTNDLSKIVDKCSFKDYIKQKLGAGYTVPMYGAWNNVNDIEWDNLPEKFVLKSNCCSDGNFIKIIKNKNDIDFQQIKEELKGWLNPYNTLVNSYCRAYWNVKPKILAEKYVEQIDGQVYDYKFFCFNGEPKFAYVASEHFNDDKNVFNHEISVYSLDWDLIDVKYGDHPHNNISAPDTLNEMIEISKTLSKVFPFVRVDFFEVEKRPVVSELTFYPGGGYNKLNPPSFDEAWGDMIVLPKKTKL